MKTKEGRTMSSLLALALALIVVGGLVSPAGLASGQAAERAPYGYAFTYQGYLEDASGPVNGACDLAFSLYSDPDDGTFYGSLSRLNTALVDGRFTVRLDFGAAAHTGDARWLAIRVRCPAGSGTYTALEPRQELTAAPAALALALPFQADGTSSSELLSFSNAGSGTALELASQGGRGLYVNSAGSHGVVVNSAGERGVFVAVAGDDGVYVSRAGSPSDYQSLEYANGFEVAGAEGNGLYVGRADVDGVMIDSAGGDGLAVFEAGQHGLFVGQCEDDGVHVGWAKGSGVSVAVAGDPSGSNYSTADNGFEVAGAQGNGLYVGRADMYGMYVESAFHGINIHDAGNVGLYVTSAGTNGIWIDSGGGNGLYVATATDGVDAYGTSYAGYFRGDIYVSGNCIGCLQAVFALNAGQAPLRPGDIVAIEGIQAAGLDNAASLWRVAPAVAAGNVVGVVGSRADLETATAGEPARDGEAGRRLVPRDGAAGPGEYLTVVISGPMRVRAGAQGGPIAAGARLAVAQDGSARALKTVVVDGVTLAESAPVLGIALDAPDGEGMVWVLVNPQ